MRATVEVYKAKDGQHYWRLIAQNGRIIADGSEGYKRKTNAVRGLNRAIRYMRRPMRIKGWELPLSARFLPLRPGEP